MKLTPCPQISARLTDRRLIASTVFADLGDCPAVVGDLDANKWSENAIKP